MRLMRRSARRAGEALNAAERRAAAALGGVLGARMLGLFVALPALPLAGARLEGATPLLVGFALGVYGLLQAALQIPMGRLSDRFGRKRLIVAGLLLFVAGSLAAASARSIEMLILGRALQGAGAVAAVVMALAADVTRPQQRSKVNALIGAGVGAAFLIAPAAGAALYARGGLAAVFVFAAAAGLLAVAGTVFGLREPARVAVAPPLGTALGAARQAPGLPALLAGGFCLHAVVMAFFMTLPQLLLDAQLDLARHWLFYAATLPPSFLPALALLARAERPGRLRVALAGAAAALGASLLLLPFVGHSLPLVAMTAILFFAAFNVLEALLPSLVGRMCGLEIRGFVMGLYASAHFLGAFVGATGAGAVSGFFGAAWVAPAAAAVALAWAALAALAAPADANAQARRRAG